MPTIPYFLTIRANRSNKSPFASYGFLFLLLVLITTSLFSCDNSSSKLKLENDSLRNQLKASNQVIAMLKTVNVLLDSIDMARNSIHSVSGGDKTDYSDRMIDLKDYIKRTEEKIKELESSVVDTDVNKESYMMMIDALKEELKFRQEEAGTLEKPSSRTEEDLDNEHLTEIEEKLESKKNELKSLELRIKELVRTLNISEADSYFAQAAAIEEAAKRTKLAPHKRKQTFQEALDLYEKALKAGKKEAKAKIEELKEKI